MALVIKEVSSNTVTEVGNVIIIEGGGLTPAQSAKLDNVPSDTITELANKVDKSGTKVLSDVNYTVGDKSKVDNVPANTNSSISAINSSISTININLTGKADLDPDTNKLSLEQLPEGYNNVVEAANLAAFPGTGVANTIYVALDTNLTYRWSGTQYTEVSQSLALGETSASAYRGDRGATAYTHSQATGNPHGLALSDISTNLEDKSSAQIRAEITESDIPVEIARTTAIPTTTTPLTDTSAKRFVTDTEKATWNGKADTGDFAAAISITGTHTETTTAIDFSSVQGKSITLTANRSYTISGLSSSNPIGILKITHAGFTPSFSGVTALDSALDKSGVYYLKFTRQPDGTITQSNQSGGGASTLEQLSGITTTTAKVNLLDTLIAGFKPGTPSISTAKSGNEITITITPGTADSRFATTHYNIYRSTDGGSNYTLYDTEATTSYVDSGLTFGTYYYYVTTANVLTVSDASNTDNETITAIFYDDFSTLDTEVSWSLVNPNVGRVDFGINSGQLELTTDGFSNTADRTNYLETQESASGLVVVAIDFISQTYNADRDFYFGLWSDADNHASFQVDTSGNLRGYIRVAGVNEHFFSSTGIPMAGKRIKVVRKANNDIEFYYGVIGSFTSWTQVSTTQNRDIGTTVKGFISNENNAGGANTILLDRFRMDNTDYASELP